MSICNGIAGGRGSSPVGIFIHNDVGSKNANSNYYRNWLQTHNLENGFAHYYVASDYTLQAEDDWNVAWHSGNSNCNANYLSIEVCQSMGDIEVFKANEGKALQLAAAKCKQYGITPSANTIRLHQEVYATACPHRSVEIHGGVNATKVYFINRINQILQNGAEYIPPIDVPQSTPSPSMNDNAVVDFTYAVKAGGVIYPFVTNLSDYAGVIGTSITDIAIKCNKGSIKYRVHILGGDDWLPWVTGCDWNDHNNGYAGNGKVIDAIGVYYETPTEIVVSHGYQEAQYRVSPVNGNYYSWQFDTTVSPTCDGYAGAFGVAIDRFQLC